MSATITATPRNTFRDFVRGPESAISSAALRCSARWEAGSRVRERRLSAREAPNAGIPVAETVRCSRRIDAPMTLAARIVFLRSTPDYRRCGRLPLLGRVAASAGVVPHQTATTQRSISSADRRRITETCREHRGPAWSGKLRVNARRPSSSRPTSPKPGGSPAASMPMRTSAGPSTTSGSTHHQRHRTRVGATDRRATARRASPPNDRRVVARVAPMRGLSRRPPSLRVGNGAYDAPQADRLSFRARCLAERYSSDLCDAVRCAGTTAQPQGKLSLDSLDRRKGRHIIGAGDATADLPAIGRIVARLPSIGALINAESRRLLRTTIEPRDARRFELTRLSPFMG